MKTSWVDGRRELRVTLKGERYGALAVSEKHEKAREVADLVRDRADRAEYASIAVGFVDSAGEAGTDEGSVQTRRTTVFTFLGT